MEKPPAKLYWTKPPTTTPCVDDIPFMPLKCDMLYPAVAPILEFCASLIETVKHDIAQNTINGNRRMLISSNS